VTLTFDLLILILNVWPRLSHDGLSLGLVIVLVLSCGLTRTHTHTHTQSDADERFTPATVFGVTNYTTLQFIK